MACPLPHAKNKEEEDEEAEGEEAEEVEEKEENYSAPIHSQKSLNESLKNELRDRDLGGSLCKCKPTNCVSWYKLTHSLISHKTCFDPLALSLQPKTPC